MKKLNTLIIVSTLALLVAGIVGCNKDDDGGDTNTAPVASFTISPLVGDTSSVFQLDASACTDAETPVENLQIRIDVNTDGIWDIDYTDHKLWEWKYPVHGDFTITLEVKDAGGLTDTETKNVQVTELQNDPPAAPSNPNPANAATGIETNATLSWTCSDPDGDPLTYDVYFGTSGNMGLVAQGISETSFNQGAMEEETTYQWKIVAKDDKGHQTEGSEWTFTTKGTVVAGCPETFTDARDGQVYAAVEIGDQCWMAENLNIGTMISGGTASADNGTIEKYCYDNTTDNCDNLGALYTWDEMMQYTTDEGAKGICPDGWHIPTDTEWLMLEVELGMTYEQATSYNWRGTDQGTQLKAGGSSGFEAVLAGAYNGTEFNSNGVYGFFFTSTQKNLNPIMAITRMLANSSEQVFYQQSGEPKLNGYSVRCLKDE